MKPAARASISLKWAGVLIAVVGFLVTRAEDDVDRLRDEALSERTRRLDAEDAAERLRGDLDGALERLHEATRAPDA